MATLYFNATSSGDETYSNVANWWTDVGATVPAGVIPTVSDDIIVQTPMQSDSNADNTGVNTAIFNDNTYLASTYYGYDLSCNLATFNGNSYLDNSSGIDSLNGLTGNAVFNNTATNRSIVVGKSTFNYLTATLNGSIYQITDVTGYGVGVSINGAYDSANHLIQIVNFETTNFESGGYMENENGDSGDVAINFYNSTANYAYIFGSISLYDYSQNFGFLDAYPTVIYPNPNVVVGGEYAGGGNKGAIYIGYGTYFSDLGPGGDQNGDWGDTNNWFDTNGTYGAPIPTASNDDQVTFFDCWPTQDSSGSASLLGLTLYGPTQFAIPISIAGDVEFYNTSVFASTGSTGSSENVRFYNSSYNAGTLTNGTVQFFNNSYNNGTISYPGTGYGLSLTFQDNSHNAGVVTGTSAFYGNSYNSGQVGTAGGTTASFHDASQNQGVIGSTSPSAISNGDFNDTSINIGLITGNARFRYVTATSGVAVDITGYANGPVNGITYDSANNVITTWKFQGTDFMQSGATVTGNAIFVGSTGASGISVCLITGNADVYSPAQKPLQATVLGTITYHAPSTPSINIYVMLNFPFPLNYILGKVKPFGTSSLLKLPFFINK